ncbi:MAG: LysR family transcriptional regulator [Pseudomonadota bacterium]
MDITQSEIGLLVALDALLEAESVTGAAHKLGISQPAMSAQLSRLRRLFNDPLLAASGRKLVPTIRAMELKQPLRAHLANLDELVRESAQFDPVTSDRTFRVIGTDYVHSVFLTSLLQSLASQAPNARIAVLPFEPTTLWSQLEQDSADLALVTGMKLLEAKRRAGLVDTFKVIQRKDHPRGTTDFTLDTFCAADHVLISPEGGGFLGATDKLLSEMGRSRRITCSLPSFLLAPSVVAGSDLLAMMPTRLAALHAESVDQFDPPFPSPQFSVDLLWHPRRQKDPAHMWFRSIVAQIASAA